MNFTNSDNEIHPPGLFNVYFQRHFSLFCIVKSSVLENQSVTKIGIFVTKWKTQKTLHKYKQRFVSFELFLALQASPYVAERVFKKNLVRRSEDIRNKLS